MTIEAKVIAHSAAYWAKHKGDYDGFFDKAQEIVTFQLRYPRFIHAELMTHRMFSRNASSSRAIPVSKMIENIKNDTAMPIHWGKNQPGMQAFEESDAAVNVPGMNAALTSREAWEAARDEAIKVAEAFNDAGYHKQVVNRILEPFMHIDVIVTATNFDNFFWLRRHKDAQPEIKALADAMWDALQGSIPRYLNIGEWHLPYVTYEELNATDPMYLGDGNFNDEPRFSTEDLIKMSAARSARVSYLTHDGKNPDFAKDVALYDRLVGSAPLHASPTEHQATPDSASFGEDTLVWDNEDLSGNFDAGWIQYRKTLPGEVCEKYIEGTDV